MAETITERPIYQDTELKFTLDIEIEGFSMIDDDFGIVVNSTNKSVEIPKSEMIIMEGDKFLFTIDTSILGTGDYYIVTTANVPDTDFAKGYRREVQKSFLCRVTS